MSDSSFNTCFCGLHPVKEKVVDWNYVINTPDRNTQTQLCHINLLKADLGRETVAVPVTYVASADEAEDCADGPEAVESISVQLSNSKAL